MIFVAANVVYHVASCRHLRRVVELFVLTGRYGLLFAGLVFHIGLSLLHFNVDLSALGPDADISDADDSDESRNAPEGSDSVTEPH